MRVPERLALIASSELLNLTVKALAPVLVPILVNQVNGLLRRANNRWPAVTGGNLAVTR